MRTLIAGFVAGMLAVGGVMAAEKAYTLRPVTDFAVDPGKCAADGGRAGMVADIDENGYLVSGWAYVCVLEVK